MTLLRALLRKGMLCSATALFAFYRTLVAPAWQLFVATPSCCRFLPTCSEFAQEAVQRHGWKGIWMTIDRLLRCRPRLFSSHHEQQGIRFDPVPPLSDRNNRNA